MITVEELVALIEKAQRELASLSTPEEIEAWLQADDDSPRSAINPRA